MRRRFALAAAYAVVTFLSFPQPVADRVLDLGFLLGWLAPALLVLTVHGLTPRRAALWGFAASLCAHSALIHWIYVVTVVYGGASPVVGLLAPVLLSCYCALFGGVFAAAHARLARAQLDSPLALAAIWTALDHLRSWEFPWGTIGYVQHENAALLPLAAWGGVYVLSFATVLGGVALAQLAPGSGRSRRGPAAALGAVALFHVLGFLLPDPEAQPQRATVRVAVLQGNIDQAVKWNRDSAERTLQIYEGLTREASEAGAELIVWPETAVPGAIESDPRLTLRLERLAVSTGAQLVVGGVGLGVGLDDGRRARAYFDSAFAITASGETSDRYDKTKLVPFGEYVPFRPLLGLLISSVAGGAANLDVSTGDRPRGIDLAIGGSLRAGVVICYELLFPDLVRRFGADGSELLLAITNDAWYGRTGAPYQFLAMTALRSAETGLWTARAANTGVSAFIDGRGRVVASTPIFERAWRVADVPRHPAPREATFYTRHGDVFALACWLASAIQLLRARRPARAGGPVGTPTSDVRGAGE